RLFRRPASGERRAQAATRRPGERRIGQTLVLSSSTWRRDLMRWRLRSARFLFCVALVSAFTGGVAGAETPLLRFPAIHHDKVVFTYAGDLWMVSSQGGTASRLTAHPGLEMFARFSPDGKWLAFTGQYDGDEQVYVMPATGGVPRQLTFY